MTAPSPTDSSSSPTGSLTCLRSKNDGKWTLKPGSGGLVTALLPVLRDRGGVWIGWPGVTDDVPQLRRDPPETARDAGYALCLCSLTRTRSTSTTMGIPTRPSGRCSTTCSRAVIRSRVLARLRQGQPQVRGGARLRSAARTTSSGSTTTNSWTWPATAREADCLANLAFFLHIPFPSPDIFMKLPERQALLNSLLAYDLVGFQTVRDRRNFIQCVRMLIKNARVSAEGNLHVVQPGGPGDARGHLPHRHRRGRTSRPERQRRRWRKRVRAIQTSYRGRQLVLGLDRLDYTKGIPQRLRAFANLLERFPEVRRCINLLQVVVPSREGIPRIRRR